MRSSYKGALGGAMTKIHGIGLGNLYPLNYKPGRGTRIPEANKHAPTTRTMSNW